jgi:hypothetical protein
LANAAIFGAYGRFFAMALPLLSPHPDDDNERRAL